MTNLNPDNSLAGVLKTINSWKDAGFRVDEFKVSAFSEGSTWHSSTKCPTNPIQINSSKVMTFAELNKLVESNSFCKICASFLEFESNKSSSLTISSIDYIAEKVRLSEGLEFKNSLKGISKALPQRRGLMQTIKRLEKTFSLPGSEAMLEDMRATLKSFDDQMEAFRESSFGSAQIIKHAALAIFEPETFHYSLAKKSKNGKNGKTLLKESAKMKRTIQKSIDRITNAPIYSLCADPHFEFLLLDEDDGQSDEDGTIRSGLNRLISDKWLLSEESVMVLPYVVAVYVKQSTPGFGFQPIHLDEEPDARLLECVKAFHSADGKGLSLLEAYKAAVAVD